MNYPTSEELKSLIKVALGREEADLLLENGKLVNVFSGEIVPAHVAVKGKWIAYVGVEKPCCGKETMVIDASSFYLVPGYLEPHSHPAVIYNPYTQIKELLPRGITTAITDTYFFFLNISRDKFKEFTNYLKTFPFKYKWFARPTSASEVPFEKEIFSLANVRAMLDLKEVAGMGEITHWHYILKENPSVLDFLVYCRSLQKRPDGHTAGAKGAQLAALAAAGISGCHESINATQALERLRLGMYVALRNSSLRPDLKKLAAVITEKKVDTSRLMLTTDGSTPGFTREYGDLEALVQEVISQGVEPVKAIQMATLNPATYYRIDDLVGSISPGRYADILLVKELAVPKPELVIASGKVVAEKGKLLVDLKEPDWERYEIKPLAYRQVDPRIFELPAEGKEVAFPAIKVSSAVLTRREDVVLPVRGGVISPLPEEAIYKISYLDYRCRWVANGFIKDFVREIDALAASFSVGFGITVIGRDAEVMARTTEEVYRLGGGIVVMANGSVVYRFSLPLLGMMSREPFEKIVAAEKALFSCLQAHGYAYHDILYTIIFLAMSALPEIRITPAGIYDNLNDRVIYPARKLI